MQHDELSTLWRKGMDRRAFLQAAAGIAFPALVGMSAGKSAFAQGPAGSAPVPFTGLIVRQQQPENLEFPFATLDSFYTPNDRFYVRTHFATPTVDAGTWRLRVEGAVNHPLELTYDELRKMAPHTQAATLECAGNGRAYLTPKTRGVQWEQGAVSNAEWTGVPLDAILKRAGVKREAVEVIFEGADTGELKDLPKPPGTVHFARSIPLAKARLSDTLLAYKMNGADLPVAHGFPVRAVVPGWYGVASVKWLTRIIVTDTPFLGHFQTVDYAIWERENGLPVRHMITDMQVKSAIARPMAHETITAGKPYKVTGAAWGSRIPIGAVEVSTDGGKNWATAQLTGKSVPFAWRFWEYNWENPRPGVTALMARATDIEGNVQPMNRDIDRDHYMINHVLPTEVEVR